MFRHRLDDIHAELEFVSDVHDEVYSCIYQALDKLHAIIGKIHHYRYKTPV